MPRLTITIAVLLLLFVTSCIPYKKLKYFNDIDQLQEPVANPMEQKVIHPFDQIYVRVFSIDEKTNQLFNSGENIPMNSSSNIISYLVDENGNINFPFIGKINLSGLNVDAAGVKLGEALSQIGANSSVIVKFLENRVTVMGEVVNQGVYTYSKDKLNIYEALALGGGISRFGNRKSVILVRQEGDKILHHKLDLTNSAIAGKDNYYIVNNDVIIVEPLKSATWFYFNNTNFTTFLYSLTTIISILTLFFLVKGN